MMDDDIIELLGAIRMRLIDATRYNEDGEGTAKEILERFIREYDEAIESRDEQEKWHKQCKETLEKQTEQYKENIHKLEAGVAGMALKQLGIEPLEQL